MSAPIVSRDGRIGALAEDQTVVDGLGFGWRFRCPVCAAPLEASGPGRLICDGREHEFRCVDGVWRCLPEARSAVFEQFVAEYETVRRFEGRASHDADYYRALPYRDLTGRFTNDWRIRAVSFEALVKRVLKPLEARHNRPLRIIDLGAGNGWLTNRLAERGHAVAAVDLLSNTTDGLGAHRHYLTRFTSIQAEFDRLPLESHQADLVIFNGSFHYSTDFSTTLREAQRVLRPEGTIVILDSPVYRDASSGRAMVREREERFSREVGFPSNALPMENFLTFGRLDLLARQLKICWSIHEPFYGPRWAMKPWVARLRGRREPAKFLLISGQANSERPHFAWNMRRRAMRTLLRLSRPWKARRQRRIALEQVAGFEIVVLPDVFNPRLLRSGEFFASQLTGKVVPVGSRVLDLGTGSGICAIVASRWAREVVAVDINPVAVRCATVNALVNRVEDRVSVRHGDLFEPLPAERFDLVLFNPPYYRGTPRDLLDAAWRSRDVVSRFAKELRSHLSERGSALLILSTDGEEEKFLADFRANRLDVESVAWRDFGNEIFTIYRLTDSARAEHDRPV